MFAESRKWARYSYFRLFKFYHDGALCVPARAQTLSLAHMGEKERERESESNATVRASMVPSAPTQLSLRTMEAAAVITCREKLARLPRS